MKKIYLLAYLIIGCILVLHSQNIIFNQVSGPSPILPNIANFYGISKGDVAFLDLDNDGDKDVFITGNVSNSIHTFIYINDGQGNYTELLNHPFYGTQNGEIDFADFDNDGDLDICIVGDFYATLYQNNGNLNFTNVSNFNYTKLSNSSIETNDVDNDGDIDILFSGRTSFSQGSIIKTKLFINDGNANFSEQINSGLANIVSGDIEFGDIDNDGDDDLLLSGLTKINGTNTIITVLYQNNGNGVFSENPTQTLDSVMYSSTQFSDIDNDNDLDILLIGENNSNQHITKLYLNDGNGNYTIDSSVPFLQIQHDDIQFADVDNDNDLDVFIAGTGYYGYNNGIATSASRLYLNNGAGNFIESSHNNFDITTETRISFSDSDNDGDIDLLISGSQKSFLYINNGLGKFDKATSTPFISTGQSYDYADVDGDNDMDIIMNFASNIQGQWEAHLYINDGNGMYSIDTTNSFRGALNGNIKFGDIDNDNDYDVIISGRHNGPTGYQNPAYFTDKYLNNGMGSFTKDLSNHIDGTENGDIDLFDIDNDSDLDLILTNCIDLDVNNNFTTTKVYKNNGNGFFTEDINHPFAHVTNSTQVFFDYNNDSLKDLILIGGLTSNQFAPVTLLYQNMGNGVFQIVLNTPFENVQGGDINVADFDNDNDLDIIISGEDSSGTPSTKIYLNLGNGNFTEHSPLIGLEGLRYCSLDVADINGDSKVDIIISGETTSFEIKTVLYVNVGNNQFNEFTNQNLMGVKNGKTSFIDVNNDNKKDLLIGGFNYNNDDVGLLYLNNSNFPVLIVDTIDTCHLFYTWINGVTYYTNNNTATHTISNPNGSDTIVTLNLRLNSNIGTDILNACDSLTWIDGNTYYSNNNTATYTLTNQLGCDSVVTLNLTINNNFGSDVISVCDSLTWIDGNTYYTSNNTATHTLTNQFGCDSIITLNLTIQTVDTSSSYTDSSITINQNNATYQWFDCNSNSILTGETNQTIMPFTNGTYKAIINHNNCIDTSSCLAISPCNERELIHVSNSSICDTSSSILSIINDYDSYLWSNGNTFDSIIVNDSMMYYATLGMNNGCITYTDSIKLNLYDCTIFIDSTTTNIDTCLIDSTTTVSQAYINNIITQDDSVYVTWNFLLSSGDTIFLDASYYVTQNGIYNVSITINCNGLKANGTSYFDLLEVSHLTDVAIDSKLDAPFKLFPNPTNNTLYISGSENNNAKIEILATNGTLIKQTYLRPNNILEIDLSNFESALYFIKITPENSQSLIYKVIKK